MMRMPNPSPSRTGLVLAACLWLAGCAGPAGFFSAKDTAPPFRDSNLSMQSAGEAIVPGKTNRAEVIAALGKATVVKFNSGFEVWVYRGKANTSAAGRSEFVILFAPSGIVKKTRIRPTYKEHGE